MRFLFGRVGLQHDRAMHVRRIPGFLQRLSVKLPENDIVSHGMRLHV
jgi:hypothetical protein